MIKISLADDKILDFDSEVNGYQLVASLGKKCEKEALAIEIDNQIYDLSHKISNHANVKIITNDTPLGLEIMRHSCAHVLAAAVKSLFPDVKVAIGPTIADGFYYDFYRVEPFSINDLSLIEERMREMLKANIAFSRKELSSVEATEIFKNLNEEFKVEIIQDLSTEMVTIYEQGDFFDLCRGVHVPSTGKISPHFKLTKVSGAYWRADSSRPMLQRIYATLWANKKQLDDYLEQIAQAELRDHRKLGKEMDLFHIQEEAVGSIFWHPNGQVVFRSLENFIRSKILKQGYVEVKTPQLIDRSLWERSGHWEKFREVMFTAESEKRVLAIKPMNCPGHIQIFNQSIKSYRQLPYRMAEFGVCHRNEPSGSLHGLMRVRSFMQDDGHIFCTMNQVVSETKKFCQLLIEVYQGFGFNEVSVKFADRPLVRAGDDATWDKAEDALKNAVNEAGLTFSYSAGEGAFYGPKLEFGLNDALGRYWQCGTLQVDLILPERLDAEYIGEDGNRHRPVILHRAVLGSFERFIGILLEHYAGKLPLWLMPVQAVIIPIADGFNDYASLVNQKFLDADIRCRTDFGQGSLNYKIRQHSLSKTPIIIIVGGKESENNTVTIRRLGSKEQSTMPLNDALKSICDEAATP